jgi:thioredoxin-like negative regulator of GroEL
VVLQGFVGRTSDYWLADEVEDEYEARGVPSPKSRMHHSEDYKPLGGGVIEVFSEAGILRETKQGPSVLFISTDTCVVCNYLHAFYRKLVPKYEQVRFLHMNAHSDPSVITEDMGIASVPAFVIYRSGKRIMSMQTNAKDEVERSIQELLSTPIS